MNFCAIAVVVFRTIVDAIVSETVMITQMKKDVPVSKISAQYFIWGQEIHEIK